MKYLRTKVFSRIETLPKIIKLTLSSSRHSPLHRHRPHEDLQHHPEGHRRNRLPKEHHQVQFGL